MRPKRRLRFSTTTANVIALVSLFVALGGVGVAATGGNFILGQANDAGTKTSLTANVNDRAMVIENTDTGPTAGGLSLKVAPHRPPLVVNADAGKATNLDADRLDGLSSESFTQGGGRLYSGHRDGVSPGATGLLLDLPGAMSVRFSCWGGSQLGRAGVNVDLDSIGVVVDGVPGVATPVFFKPNTSWGYHVTDPLYLHVLGSRPFNRMTFRPAVLVDARIATEFNPDTKTCGFQAVAEVFG